MNTLFKMYKGIAMPLLSTAKRSTHRPSKIILFPNGHLLIATGRQIHLPVVGHSPHYFVIRRNIEY